MEGKWRTRLFLLLVGEIFQEDAQYKGLALTQLKEKSSVPFQRAIFLQLLFSKGTFQRRTKMRKYEILTWFFFFLIGWGQYRFSIICRAVCPGVTTSGSPKGYWANVHSLALQDLFQLHTSCWVFLLILDVLCIPKKHPQPLTKLLSNDLLVLMMCVVADSLAGGSSPLV